MIDYSCSYSRGVLYRLLLLMVVATGLLIFGTQQINALYFENQLTPVGLIINGTIFALFLLGMVKIIITLLQYQAEEKAICSFAQAMDAGDYQPADEIDPKRIIHKRYALIRTMSKQNAVIDHSALASILVANESTRISFPKFIHNILILSGVFGTIVSLSMSLVGASNLLESADAFSNMGMVIHGMSTALSTTITAIVSYLIFGYFYLRLTDVQTRLLSRVEEVTTLYLIPRYSVTGDSMLTQVSGLIQSLQEIAIAMQNSQKEYADTGRTLNEVAQTIQDQIEPMGSSIKGIKSLLHEGFRLPQDSSITDDTK
ncbi:MAG: hypothetical protein GQ470_01075 [Gammaproteobacteria bacterium]|nr:hypothetical protein [Gammaproteobacteria bacterium]